MNKVYKSIITAVLCLAGGGLAHSQTAYYNAGTEYVTEIEEGREYALASAAYSSSGTYYLSGSSYSTSSAESIVYQFEKVGTTADNFPEYILKQVSTGKYLESPTLSGEETPVTLKYTESKSRAFVFTAKQSVGYSFYSGDEMDAVDLSIYTYASGTDYPFHEGAFVLCSINWEEDDYPWLMFNGSGPAWSPQYVNTNTWYVYPVTKAGAYDALCLYFDSRFSNGSVPADKFAVGNNYGQVSSELLDALQVAYDEAAALVNDPTQSDETYAAAQLALENAYKACSDGCRPIDEGYVVIRNHESDRYNGNGCMYDAGGSMYFDEFVYSEGQELTADDADFIWQIIKSDTDDYYYLRNFSTGRYVGTQTSVSTCVPTTEEPSQTYRIGRISKDAFAIYNTAMSSSYPALHAQTAGSRVVIWGYSSAGSWWYFVPVDAAAIEKLSDAVAQLQLNESTSELISTARAALGKGVTIDSNASADGLYDDLGFVTDASQFFSNAKEPTEGSFEGLIDNNQQTIFHSVWSDGSYADLVHYLGVDLGKEVQYLSVKYSRRNTGTNGTPYIIHVYATNDTTGLAAGTCEWSDELITTLSYPYASNATYSTEGTANFTGIAGIALSAPYRYLRFDVEHTMSDGRTNGNLYFHLSEFHLYEGTYNAEASLIEGVPADIVAALREAIANAQAALAAGDVSQATYDALKSALENFNANYPDPTALKSLISEAQAQHDAAEEGAALGYFADGSKAALQSVLDAVSAQIRDVMTMAEIQALTAQVNAAITAFVGALNKPADGAIVRIKSATTGDAANSFVYATDSDESAIKWGGYSSTDGQDAYLSERLNYHWRVINNADGSISLQNLGMANYFGNPEANNVGIYMSVTPATLSLRSAKVPGLFNLVMADGIFANAKPGTYTVVTWNSASGTDNSAFEFELASDDDWQNSYHLDLTNKAQVLTLPLAVTGLTSNGHLYKVAGIKDNAVQLLAYEDEDEIAAGVPVVYVPSEDAESGTVDLYPAADAISSIVLVTEAGSQNGLVGCLQSAKPGEGVGRLLNGVIVITTADDAVGANSGWFTGAIPETTEDGAVALQIDGDLSSIGAIIYTPSTTVDVYTLTGVKVRSAVKPAAATNALPRGLYIVGGKKVLVK